MRLRTTLIFAFATLSILQIAIVVPLALQNLSTLLVAQHEARVEQLMVAARGEAERLRSDIGRSMNELATSSAMEDAARDAAQVPAPPTVTRVASQLMTPRGLDVLALLDDQGRTISSGHLPARLGEPDDPLFAVTRLAPGATAVLRVETSGASGLASSSAVVTARPIEYGERKLWAVGGVMVTDARAATFSKLTGARVEVWAGETLAASAGTVAPPVSNRMIPLGNNVELRLTFSRADLEATKREVLTGFAVLALLSLCFSIVAGIWVSRRVTRPVEAITDAAARIAAGEPGVKVALAPNSGELKTLVDTFNRMTEDLKAATDRLLASERVAAWQEVARRVAHEIKNPLTPIRMSLETLLAASQRQQLDPKFQALFKESAQAVLEEVDRLKRIVDEFSQFARLPKPELKPLPLSEALTQVMSLYADHDGVKYEVSIAPGVQVLGDRDQLTQAVVNLVKNAEEAMQPQGGGRVSVRLSAQGAEVLLAVEDEGPGIPAELKARLFEPYVTTKAQGTGLGLAIVSRIVQEHSGKIDLQDATPRGTRFSIRLPALQ